MSTLGQDLNRERELRGIPLQEIARQTKINIHYLMALEQDRLDLLPGEFFIKGTIRAYAKCIGLDENQALNLYFRAGPQPAQAAVKHGKPPSPQMSPGRWRKLAFILLLPLLLAAVLLFLKPWAESGRKTGAPSQPARSGASVEPGTEAAPAPPSAPEQPAAALGAGLVLTLTFRDEVWIRVQSDGGPAEESLMRAGDRKSISAADRVVMRLGRPDQVEMTINGRKAKPFSASASAQTYEINKDNSRTYLAE